MDYNVSVCGNSVIPYSSDVRNHSKDLSDNMYYKYTRIKYVGII